MFVVIIGGYYDLPFKNRMPQNFEIANFGHAVSKSWIRHCIAQLPCIFNTSVIQC